MQKKILVLSCNTGQGHTLLRRRSPRHFWRTAQIVRDRTRSRLPAKMFRA